MTAAYCELHLHTCFSFLDGASFPAELVGRAVELGYSALAVTDHNGLYGAMEFAQAARDAGMQPITGAEVTLENETHLTLLAETVEGYGNLAKLITIAHHHGAYLEPRLPLEALAEHSGGLILLTGCRQGEAARLIDGGDYPAARAVVARYADWFGADNVFVELQHNLVHGDSRRMVRLAELADELRLGCVATGNVHYHLRERQPLQDVMTAIRQRSTLDGSHAARRPNSEFFLQPPEVMARRFRHIPEAIANSARIAARCAAFNLTRDLQYRFPDYPTEPDETADDVLAREAHRLLRERYPAERMEAGLARLEQELGLVKKHKLAGFFLVYRDIMELAKEVADEVRGSSPARRASNLPPGRGRGSSVSSIICYLIGLSHIDPIQHNLFIGRFLNEEIASVPDIDLDFPRDIRERLIERIYEVYGHDKAALVCAFPTYRIRSAIRDIGKALGLPMPALDRLAKLSDRVSAAELADQIALVPDIDHNDSRLWQLLVDLAKQIAGMPRHVSQHSGGMIISSQPLNELVPIQPAAMEGRFICHWDKDSCDDARFIKIDFLALGMLSMVEECLELIAVREERPVDLSRIDFADKRVFDMIARGDTIGVFQIESRAQIQTLLKTQPERLEDLIVQVAIVRPGPIVGGAVSPFIQSRRQVRELGYATPEYDHPLLEPVLKETYGIILYQEQVIETAMTLAGFTAGEADRLRRAMSRKRSVEAMQQFWEQFRDGAAGRGVPEETAKLVFDKIMGFAAYGFPKSHAAAFAVLAYQSCWLRYYYPAEFFCALFNNQPMGFYPPHVLVNDAKRTGVRTLPPDVNASRAKCSVETGGVRVGLSFVSGMGEEAGRLIVAERERGGEYRSLADFVRRVPLKRDVIERLVLVGAFDQFGLRRREALWMLGLFMPQLSRVAGDAHKPRQLALRLPVEQDMVELAPMSAWEQMSADYSILGLSPRYHPLLLLRSQLPAELVTTADLFAAHERVHTAMERQRGKRPSGPLRVPSGASGRRLRDGQRIAIAGLVVCRQRPSTAKGITFLLLEDEHNLVNVVVYPQLHQQRRLLVRNTPLLIVEGRLQLDGDTVNIVALDFKPIDVQALQGALNEAGFMQEDAVTAAAGAQPLQPKAHNFH